MVAGKSGKVYVFACTTNERPPRVTLTEQDKRLNIWSTASGKHVRAYKVEPSAPQSTERLASSSSEGGGGGGGAMTGGGSIGGADGSGVGGGSGAKGKAGGELFKVDLDPTGMYAAACSFDKVCAKNCERMRCSSRWAHCLVGRDKT